MGRQGGRENNDLKSGISLEKEKITLEMTSWKGYIINIVYI